MCSHQKLVVSDTGKFEKSTRKYAGIYWKTNFNFEWQPWISHSKYIPYDDTYSYLVSL